MTAWVHQTMQIPHLSFSNGSEFFFRARWATSNALLDAPAGRSPANYSETPDVYISVDDITFLMPSRVWWESLKDVERYMYGIVEYRYTFEDPWTELYRDNFVINHDPIANAGPDQIITLDATGRVTDDILIDGSASFDPDSVYPDHVEPLNFSWTLESTPATADVSGVVTSAASRIENTSNPLFLPALTQVPTEDRGMYTFSLTVSDNETATAGKRMGKSGAHSVSTRVYLEVVPPDLSIVSPKNNTPHIGNWDDHIGSSLLIPITYSLGAIGDNTAYGGAWIVRLTIRQAIQSPFGASPPVGTVLFRAEKISPNARDQIIWDGIITEGNLAGNAALGGFTIELDLLDRYGQSVARPGNPGDYYTVTETNALAIDIHRWIPPVNLSWPEIRLTGCFMESGHQGYGRGQNATRLHGGSDIGPGRTPGAYVNNPDVIAAASGLYERVAGSTVNTMRIRHSAAQTSIYMHCDNRDNHGNGTLVIQGARLGRMSNISPHNVPTHLHFEYHVELPVLVISNPLLILDLPDAYPAIIDGVYLRSARPIGQPARLTVPPPPAVPTDRGIAGQVDIIVHCRDRAHRHHGGPVWNAPLGLSISDSVGTFNGLIEFYSFTPGNNPHLRDYYTDEGQQLFTQNSAVNRQNHYHLYLRGPSPAGRESGPVTYLVQAYDYANRLANYSELNVTVGAEVRLVNGPPDPALTAAGGNTFQVTIEVANRTENVEGVNEDFHIELVGLAGAPADWTVAPARTGVQLAVGAPNNHVLTIDSRGIKPLGIHNFEIVVYSDILSGVGTRVAFNARIQ